MKTKKILSVIVISVVAITTIIFANRWISKEEKKYSPIFSPFVEEEGEEYVGIKGAMEWLYEIQKNPDKGYVDPIDVLKARKEAIEFDKNSPKNNYTWQELGPDNIGGRVRAFLIDRNNHNLLYAAGVSGGLWRSYNAGASWQKITNITNDAEFINISCITQATNGDLYVGTGESFLPIPMAYLGVANGVTAFIGGGIWKSTDNGNTWIRLTSTEPEPNSTNAEWAFVNELATYPYTHITTPNYPGYRLFASTNKGVRISDDGGITWYLAQIDPISNINQSNSNDIKVASDGSVITQLSSFTYISPNGDNNTYTKVSGGGSSNIPTAGRIEYAFSPQDPNYVYALLSTSSSGGTFQGIYRSTDKGQTWTAISATTGASMDVFGEGDDGSGQGEFDNCITVHPTDKDQVFIGGIDLWRGKKYAEGLFQWEKITLWYLPSWYPDYAHADHHAIVFHPTNPNIVYDASDGGISKSTDGGVTWFTQNKNLNITQFYTVACNNKSWVMGGTQDNGTLMINYQGNTPQWAKEISGGDGGFCAFSNANEKIYFSSVYYGDVHRFVEGTQDYNVSCGETDQQCIRNTFFGEKLETVVYNLGTSNSFVTPLLLWENVNDTLVVPIVSKAQGGDTIGYDSLKPNTSFFLGLSGHVWMTKKALLKPHNPDIDCWFKITPANFSGTVQTMAITSDGNTLFVGNTNGRLYRITNLSQVLDSIQGDVSSASCIVQTDLINTWSNRVITSIAVDYNNPNHIVVTLGNYGQNVYVYRSTNALSATVTFTPIQGSGATALPRMPVYASVINKFNSNMIFVGTEHGVYVSEDNGANWAAAKTGMYNVPVFMLCQEQDGDGNIFAGTHGRGLFKLPGDQVGIKENQKYVEQINIYPNPVKENAFISYDLESISDVQIYIYDFGGKLVKTFNLPKQSAGKHNLTLNLEGLNAGTYIIHLKTEDKKFVSKFIKI